MRLLFYCDSYLFYTISQVKDGRVFFVLHRSCGQKFKLLSPVTATLLYTDNQTGLKQIRL